MERPTVAIITDDAAFANALTRRWLTEREVPAFVLVQGDSDFQNTLDFDLAVAVRIAPENLAAAVNLLNATNKPAILVSSLNGNSPHGPKLTVLPEVLEWPNLVVLVSQQMLQRERSKQELNRFQQTIAELERDASLGRFMLEVRHNLNNALTSVLGNSDLILLDAEQLPATLRQQVETIRNMSMRMNEIMHRFSSLQKEMQLMEEQSMQKVSKAAAGRG
ncbi:MAG TPA: histidine kinase dimerization/phospho-acceptor domain-containing protein [Terriglobales bacterium]|nr:histidine kinase dimerization/phospho-acceptor domain-containing protein [Terriglobales bacterium]